MIDVLVRTPGETFLLGQKVGRMLPPCQTVAFFGELAAGKTTFIKGLVEGAAGYSSEMVNSPTFVYLHVYEGSKTVYHFDLYRLTHSDEFFGMGFDDFLFTQGICCIEWAERIEELLPPDTLRVVISHDPEGRRIRITPWEDHEAVRF